MAASANQLRDMTVLHQIGLQRFSLTVNRRILKTLRETQSDIEAQIKERLPDRENGERDPQSLRLNGLLQQVRLTQDEAHRAISATMRGQLDEAIDAEAAFAGDLSRAAISPSANLATVSADQLRASVMSRPFQGLHLRDWIAKFEDGAKQRMKSQITMGYLEGESVQQIVRRVRVSAATVTERGAEMVVRTSLTHINARAVTESAKANPDLFTRYQWTSILDNRTTAICQSHAGKVFDVGKGPQPPAHPNCRSSIFLLVRGVDPADDMGFDTWMKALPVDAQKDILGPTRLKLWKEGMPIERFTDGGRALTLDQMRARDKAAFKAAGL